MGTETADVVVIGGGIAGVSAAHFLALRAEVVVVEAEPVLAHHTTGRSAAVLVESYGHPAVRGLTRAGRSFLTDPPDGLSDTPLVAPRSICFAATADDLDHLDDIEAQARAAGTTLGRLDEADAVRHAPFLRPGHVAAALLEPAGLDLDVHAIHGAFTRGARRAGATVVTRARVTGLHRRGAGWMVEAGDHRITTSVVVDAAGAWGDVVADLAGVAPIGLAPMRRTAFVVPAPADTDTRSWPLTVDAAERWYVKPEGPTLLCSLADETPSEPCDARPEEVDVALAIDRINEATTLGLRSVRRAWAGLRTFAPDRAPVIGVDPDAPGFFWLVGQGGTGIQTAPGAGELAASLILDGAPPPSHLAAGVDPAALAPDRFR